jgi:hypothetical protein
MEIVKSKYVIIASWVISFMFWLSSIFIFIFSNWYAKVGHIIISLLLLILCILASLGKIKIVKNLYTPLYLILCMFDAFVCGWTSGVVLTLFCTLPFVVFFFNKTKYLDIYVILTVIYIIIFNLIFIILPEFREWCIINIMGYTNIAKVIKETLYIHPNTMFYWLLFMLELVIVTVTYIGIKSINASFKTYERNLRTYIKTLETKVQDYKNNLYTAKKIQKLFLPDFKHLKNIKYFDIQAGFRPVSHMGGDFYDVYENKDGNLRVFIGDISGHTIESGLFMLALSVTIKTLLDRDESIEEVYKSINELLFYLNRKTTKKNSKNMTMNIFYQVSKDSWEYVGKHEKILIYRNSTNTFEIIETMTDSIFLGLFKDIKDCIKIKTLKIHPKDIMFLYTDGLTDILNLDIISNIVKENKDNFFDIRNDIINIIEKTYEKNNDYINDDISFLMLKRKY